MTHKGTEYVQVSVLWTGKRHNIFLMSWPTARGKYALHPAAVSQKQLAISGWLRVFHPDWRPLSRTSFCQGRGGTPSEEG